MCCVFRRKWKILKFYIIPSQESIMSKQEIVLSDNLGDDLSRLLANRSLDDIFILCDEKTYSLCLPYLLDSYDRLRSCPVCVIGVEMLTNMLIHCLMYGCF